MDKLWEKYELIIFDIDGTITEIKPEIVKKYPRAVTPNKLGEQQAIAGMREILADIKKAGIHIALATNRGGVAWGYSTFEESISFAQEAADLCGIPEAKLYISPYHAKAKGPRVIEKYALEHDWRKPNPGMLLQAMEDFKIEPQNTLFVGDRETDKLAAENANLDFQWANKFFNF
jgi:D-glycero-D-manno-heptose 1,7-bisphosphate phosphatase